MTRDTAAQVLDYVRRTFPFASNIEAEDALFSSGLLDSLELAQLELWIERTYLVGLNYGDLHINATDSVRAVARMIDRKTHGQEESHTTTQTEG